jgi:high-affinity K+ transport system ATPase subunit B
VWQNKEAIGIIHLKDTVKRGMKERLQELKNMGIKTIMCTADNRLTAATIAAESGVDKYVAESKPEDNAILSAVIFNAVIIPALIPLAMRGVTYKSMSADSILMRNIVIYGATGLIVPFVGIKAIDVLINALHIV